MSSPGELPPPLPLLASIGMGSIVDRRTAHHIVARISVASSADTSDTSLTPTARFLGISTLEARAARFAVCVTMKVDTSRSKSVTHSGAQVGRVWAGGGREGRGRGDRS